MTDRTCQIRFMDNNYNDAEATNVIATKSSESASFPASNARDPKRSRVWKPAGHFEITSANNKIYIFDGADKTATLTLGHYTTGALLATEVATQLNAVSSNWSCVYNASPIAGTFKFRINRTTGASRVLRFSQTTTAAWDTLGFTQSLDSPAFPWVADEPRNHTDEWYQIDTVNPMEVTFVAAIGPIDEDFSVSSSATIQVQANNIDLWSSPPLSVTLDRSDRGAFKFLDHLAEADRIYRYWRFRFIDRTNPIGPSSFKIGNLYFGDYLTLATTNVSRGFSKRSVDPSNRGFSESGVTYTNRRPKYREFSSLDIQNIPGDEHRSIEQLFFDLGVGENFYVSLDPTLGVSSSLDELTFYALFDNAPTFSHLFKDYYRIGFELREGV